MITIKIIHALKKLARLSLLITWLDRIENRIRLEQDAKHRFKLQKRIRGLMSEADIAFTGNNFPAAVQLYKRVLSLGDGSGDLRLMAKARCNLAAVLQKQNVEGHALFELEIASALMNQLIPPAPADDPLMETVQSELRIVRATILGKSGMEALQRRNFAVARQKLASALDEWGPTQVNPRWKASTLAALADTNVNLGDTSQAIELLRQAIATTEGACKSTDPLLVGLRRKLDEAEDRSLMDEAFPAEEAARVNAARAKIEELTQRCTQLVLAGEFNNARYIADKALQHALQQLGPTHWLVPQSRNVVAWTMMLQHDWWSALEELETTRAEMKNWWGEFPELSKLVRNNLAVCASNTTGGGDTDSD